LLQWVAGAINTVVNMFNNIIKSINAVIKAAGGKGGFGLLSAVKVPAFAEGGFVAGPTLGLVGEAGREYIVPEAKAAGFAANFLAGARGAAAIPTTGGGTGGGGPVTVNLTTGPLQQMPDGRHGVAIEDVEKMIRETVRQLRTPAGRFAMGVR
jgi:hypothetical protein